MYGGFLHQVRALSRYTRIFLIKICTLDLNRPCVKNGHSRLGREPKKSRLPGVKQEDKRAM
jgi:hypothetical protein